MFLWFFWCRVSSIGFSGVARMQMWNCRFDAYLFIDISCVCSAYVSVLRMSAFRMRVLVFLLSFDLLINLFRSMFHAFLAFLIRMVVALFPFSAMSIDFPMIIPLVTMFIFCMSGGRAALIPRCCFSWLVWRLFSIVCRVVVPWWSCHNWSVFSLVVLVCRVAISGWRRLRIKLHFQVLFLRVYLVWFQVFLVVFFALRFVCYLPKYGSDVCFWVCLYGVPSR